MKRLIKWWRGDWPDFQPAPATLSRSDFEASSLERMRPMTTVVLILGVLEYLLFVFVRSHLPELALPWAVPGCFIGGLAVLTFLMSRTRSVRSYGVIGVAYAALLELAFLFSSHGVANLASWVLPALMIVPIAAGPLWLTRWQFIYGTAIIAVAIAVPLSFVDMSIQELHMARLYFVMNVTLSAVLHVIFFSLRTQSFVLAASLSMQAASDGLTGLRNRRSFLEEGAKVLAEPAGGAARSAALYIDLDNFKSINDTFGHHAGDEALRRVAAVLRQHVRGTDLVGRLGGEEFAVLCVLTDEDEDEALELAERLREAVASIDWGMAPLTISVGLSRGLPGEGIGTLLQRVDTAMLAAERNGKNRVEAGQVHAARTA